MSLSETPTAKPVRSRRDTKVTLTNRQLHELVLPVLNLAAPDAQPQRLNSLAAVRLLLQDGCLIAAATDRYRVGIKRVLPVSVEGGGEFSALVSTADLRALLGLFRPGRRSVLRQPRLTLTVRDDVLLAESVAGQDHAERHIVNEIRLGCQSLDPSGWPHAAVFTLAARALDAEPLALAAGLDARLLSSFQEATRWTSSGSDATTLHAQMVEASATGSVLLIRVDDDFVGLLAPKRVEPPRGGDWIATLSPAPLKALS